MNFELKIRNIVLVGLFNPLTFDKYFFIKNGIILEDQPLHNQLFLPDFVQLVTPNFNLTINNIQLVLSALNSALESNEIAQILIRILEISRDIKIGGSGINFNWYVSDDKNAKSLPSFSKRLFFNPNNKLQNEIFNEEDATFGFYSSKNLLNTRLKLDVKPVIYKEITQKDEEAAIQFQFNFHKDYKDSDIAKSELKELLLNYDSFRKETEKILGCLV